MRRRPVSSRAQRTACVNSPRASRSSTSALPAWSKREISTSPTRRSASCWAVLDTRTGRGHDQPRESLPSSGTHRMLRPVRDDGTWRPAHLRHPPARPEGNLRRGQASLCPKCVVILTGRVEVAFAGFPALVVGGHMVEVAAGGGPSGQSGIGVVAGVGSGSGRAGSSGPWSGGPSSGGVGSGWSAGAGVFAGSGRPLGSAWGAVAGAGVSDGMPGAVGEGDAPLAAGSLGEQVGEGPGVLSVDGTVAGDVAGGLGPAEPRGQGHGQGDRAA